MRFYPIFMKMTGQKVLVSGAGKCAVAKLRLLLKTEADISVFGTAPHGEIQTWAGKGQLVHYDREIAADDIASEALLYCANDDAALDLPIAALGRAAGALVNVVDNLDESAFITPAIVDRDPVTIAIGTEGAAPVVARDIKRRLEAMLPASLGALTRIGQAFRPHAEAIPQGPKRRDFWSRFYFGRGPEALTQGGIEGANALLEGLLADVQNAAARAGHVHIVGAGPGDPELLTLKARNLLHEADVVLHDHLVSDGILELARREANLINVGKRGFCKSTKQDDINALMIEHALDGAQVVRLKGGDPATFARLDEELDALGAAGIAYSVVPGITAAAAAVNALGQSFTKRGRNSGYRTLTGHDIKGFAEFDWKELAQSDDVVAVYMGKKSSAFLRGRLLMHGANGKRPVSIVENASRPDQRVITTDLASLPEALEAAKLAGPAIIFLGLAPRQSGLGDNFVTEHQHSEKA